MDWNAGYVSDIEYTMGFYREQSPTHLNFVCALNAQEPIPLDKPFTYFELGFGRGLTVTVQAATNPNGRFYAADFNPAHVAGARQTAESAKLGNLTLLENSFEDLACGRVPELPMFDFITLHGIYTWVSPENRANIRKFIGRYLKPGGIVYVSYNAMPGWAQIAPVQRLLLEYAAMHPGRSDAQIAGARDLIGKMEQCKASYFTQNSGMASRLQTLREGDKHYLVHEYMNDFWQPVYHADLARDLATDAKLDYVGSAELAFTFPSLYLAKDRQELLQSISDPAARETIKDYLLNTSFRKDVFIRGARSMRQARFLDRMCQFGFTLNTARDKASLKLKLPFGEVNAKEELYNPVLDALGQRPHSFAELLSLPVGRQFGLPNIMQVVTLLVSTGHLAVYMSRQPNAAASSGALNQELSAQIERGSDYLVLCAPMLSAGFPATIVEMLVWRQLAAVATSGSAATAGNDHDVAAIAERVWNIMSAQGRKMMKDGKALESFEENLAEATSSVDYILKVRVPIWRQLGIL